MAKRSGPWFETPRCRVAPHHEDHREKHRARNPKSQAFVIPKAPRRVLCSHAGVVVMDFGLLASLGPGMTDEHAASSRSCNSVLCDCRAFIGAIAAARRSRACARGRC